MTRCRDPRGSTDSTENSMQDAYRTASEISSLCKSAWWPVSAVSWPLLELWQDKAFADWQSQCEIYGEKPRHHPVQADLPGFLRHTGHISRLPNPMLFLFTTGNLEAPQGCRAADRTSSMESPSHLWFALKHPETSWTHAFIWSVDVIYVELCAAIPWNARPALACLFRRMPRCHQELPWFKQSAQFKSIRETRNRGPLKLGTLSVENSDLDLLRHQSPSMTRVAQWKMMSQMMEKMKAPVTEPCHDTYGDAAGSQICADVSH